MLPYLLEKKLFSVSQKVKFPLFLRILDVILLKPAVTE